MDRDEAMFTAACEAYRARLRMHCYRMMGSVDEAYDATIIGDGQLPLDRVRAVRAPTLAIAAGKAPPFMRETAETVARTAPDGRALILEEATHDLAPDALAPPLFAFFGPPS